MALCSVRWYVQAVQILSARQAEMGQIEDGVREIKLIALVPQNQSGFESTHKCLVSAGASHHALSRPLAYPIGPSSSSCGLALSSDIN